MNPDLGPVRRRAAALAMALAAGCASDAPLEPELELPPTPLSAEALVEGVATYRERMALPPGALFEAILEDVSATDAPAKEIARSELASPSGPPFRFAIAYDPADIEPAHAYSVRARVTLGGELMFTSDSAHLVLTRGNGRTVDILLKRAGSGAQDASQTGQTVQTGAAEAFPAAEIGAHGLALPATFQGTLPCHEGADVRYHLDLWPDQVFHLRREVLDTQHAQDELGRWRADPVRGVLVLQTGAETPLELEIAGPDRLRQPAPEGAPAAAPPSELVSLGALEPIDLSLTVGGELAVDANGAARLTECSTGRTYAVAAEGELERAKEAYAEALTTPGAGLYVTFEGSLAERSGGDERSAVIDRFIGAWPDQRCERAQADASLTNTYWRIHSLEGQAVDPTEGRREPHLLLRGADGEQRYSATVGCNQMAGSFALEGETLTFGEGIATRMACPPPLDQLEERLARVLAATRGWRIEASTLELADESGSPIALFEAVYF